VRVAPEPKPAPPKPESPKKPPPKKKEEPKKAEPKPSVPAPAGATAPTGPSSTPGSAPAGSAGPSGTGGGSISSLDAGDFAFAWYRATVTAALSSQWRKPLLDGVPEDREVSVSFEIMRDGTVRGARIERSSGVPSLDRSALRAVADASPLPPLPAAYKEPALPARYLFVLHPD
jgi:protein TonB